MSNVQKQNQATVINRNVQCSTAATFVILLFGILLITGCGSQTAPFTPTPDLTGQAATLTPTAALTATPTPTSPPFTHCQEIIDAQLPKDFLTEGSIIFSGECEGKEGLYKLSAATHRIEPFLHTIMEDGYLTDLNVSNDHQWLAIRNSSYDSTSNLIIVGENETNTIQYPIHRSWNHVDQWLKGELISLWTEGLSWSGTNSRIFLNPFTGGVFLFDFYPDDMNWSEQHMVLDPAVARIVYFNESRSYVLKEIATERILWKSESDTDGKRFIGEPKWSPNGMYFVIPMQMQTMDADAFNLIVVGRDGHEETISDVFHIVQETYSGAIDVEWSLDGKYLYFWSKMENGDIHFILWEPLTNQIVYRDVGINFEWQSLYSLQADQQLIFHSYPENSIKTNYFVDLASGKTAQLDLTLSPMAWIKTNQPLEKRVDEPFPLPPVSGTSVKQVCLKTQEPGTQPLFDGAIVFFQGENLNLYKILSNGEATPIANTNFGFVSPNRKWLFYIKTGENFDPHFWLYSLDRAPTEIQTTIIHGEYLSEAVKGWINDDELWVDGTDAHLFNPFTLKFRKPPEFADPDVAGCISQQCPSSTSLNDYYIYDSDFKRYAFLSGGFPDGNLIMIDPDANFLWKRYSRFAGWNMPKWQPGDKLLGVPLPKNENDNLGEHYEIYTIDRDGHQRQLTDYSAAYPTMTIDKFSWSPDGRYIAFWGDTHSRENIAQQNPYRLFVLDTITRQTTDYCVAGSYASESTPVWSPDGSQMAIEGLLDSARRILIVDFAVGTVTPLAEGELVGWMAKK